MRVGGAHGYALLLYGTAVQLGAYAVQPVLRTLY